MDPCIKANYAMTLAYTKLGYLEKVIGKLFLADIGLSLELYRKMGLDSPNFFNWKKEKG